MITTPDTVKPGKLCRIIYPGNKNPERGIDRHYLFHHYPVKDDKDNLAKNEPPVSDLRMLNNGDEIQILEGPTVVDDWYAILHVFVLNKPTPTIGWLQVHMNDLFRLVEIESNSSTHQNQTV